MKKTIIKTVIITLVSIILAASLAVGIILAVSPKTIGKVFTKCGNYDAAAKLYESQYKKTESVSDLVELVRASIVAEDYELTSVYGEKLTIDYKENLMYDFDSVYDDYNNYSTATVEAYYKLGKIEDCVRVAFLTSDSFTVNKSLYYLFKLCDEKEDKTLANGIYVFYKKNSSNITVSDGEGLMKKRINDYQKKYDLFYYE